MPTALTSMPRRRTGQGCAFSFFAARRSRFLYADLSQQPPARARTRPGGLRLHADAGRDDGPGAGRRPAGSGQARAARARQAPGSETETEAEAETEAQPRRARSADRASGRRRAISVGRRLNNVGVRLFRARLLGLPAPRHRAAPQLIRAL